MAYNKIGFHTGPSGNAQGIADYFSRLDAVAYREPFYHSHYERWVVPVDVLSPVPLHGLVWEWETAVVQVGELQ